MNNRVAIVGLLAASLLCCRPLLTIAQPITDPQGDVGIGTVAPHPSAVLELQSTTKGFLLPRMTTVQRNTILIPAHGLLIFNTTDREFEYNFGTQTNPQWHRFVSIDTNGRLRAPLSEGAIWYGNSLDMATELPIGIPGQVLQVNTPGNAPEWSSSLNIDTLTVNGTATFHDSLNVQGPVNFDSTVVFRGDSVIISDSTVLVAGGVTFGGDTTIFNNTYIEFNGDTVIFSDTTVVNLGDNIIISGDTTLITNNYTEFNGDTVIFSDTTVVNFGGEVNFDSTVIFNDSVVINGKLIVDSLCVTGSADFGGETTFDSTVVFNDSVIFNGFVNIGGDSVIVFSGDTVIFSDTTVVNLGDNIIISGDTTLITNNYTEFNGDTVIFSDTTVVNLGDNIIISGDTTLITNNYTEFNGDTVIFSDTTVVNFDGEVNFDSTVVFNDSVFINGKLTVDSLCVTGSADIGGVSTFNDSAIFNGPVIFNELPDIIEWADGDSIGVSGTIYARQAMDGTIDGSADTVVVTDDGRIGIGTSNPFQQLHITENIVIPNTGTGSNGIIYKGGLPFIHNFNTGTFVGLNAGNLSQTTGPNTGLNIGVGAFALSNIDAAEHNVAVGGGALASTTTGGRNIGIGTSALSRNVTGAWNIAIGTLSGQRVTTGSSNIAIGEQSLTGNVTGSSNIALGFQTLFGFGSPPGQSHSGNIVFGYRSGFRVTTGSYNLLAGMESGLSITSGNNNIMLGGRSGQTLTTGNNNLLIGYNMDLPIPTGSNQLSIGNLIFGTGINGVGTTISSGNIGIGINAPSNRLHVSAISDPLRVQGLVTDNSLDNVVVVDGLGVAHQRTVANIVASNAWALTGNSGTSAATNFIGTMDDVGVVFRTDNTERARFQSGTNGGHFVPGADDTYDLGSPSLRWQDLYLGPASLHFPTLSSETGTAQDWAIGVDTTLTVKRGNFQITNAGAESVNITPAGNVGIGPSFGDSPHVQPVNATLTVQGDMRVSRRGLTGFNGSLHLADQAFGGSAPYFFQYFLANEADFRMSHNNNHVVRFQTGRADGLQSGRMEFRLVSAGPTIRVPFIISPSGVSVRGSLSLASATPLSVPGSGAGNLGDLLVSNGGTTTPSWQSPNGISWGLRGNSGTNPVVDFVGTSDTFDLVFRTNNVVRARFDEVNGGHFIPGADDTYDLGSSSTRWRDLYLGPTSLHFVSTSGETGTARDWGLQVQEAAGASQGNFRITEGGSDVVNITPGGRIGFQEAAPQHRVHSVASATTDEFAAVYGESDLSTANQVIGVWGDASNTSTTNTGTIGLLATGNGNTTAGQTNVALQVNDGEVTMGRSTETGIGYTVVEGATAGTAYSAEGPSGVISLTLGGGNLTTVAPTSGTFQDLGTVTITNRYVTAESIVQVTVLSKVDEGTGPNPEDAIYMVDVDDRAAGSFVLRIGLIPTVTNGTNYQNGDEIRVGFTVINPSR